MTPSPYHHALSSAGIVSPHSAHLLPCLLSLCLCLILISCNEGHIPQVKPAIDAKARLFLKTLATQDLVKIREPLNKIGKERVNNISMATTFGYLESGTPQTVILINAETAISTEPTYAERHRLTYTLECSDNNRYYFFFEATVEKGDTLISGFMIEPRKQ